MVRVKHRYLAVEVLYPLSTLSHDADLTAPGSQTFDPTTMEPAMIFRRPTPDTITAFHLIRAIRDNLQQLFGETGAALAGGSGLKIVYFSNATSTFIVRCRREAYREVWAALCFLRCLPVPVEKRHADQDGSRGRGRGRGRGGFRGTSGSGPTTRTVEQEEEVEVVMRVIRVSGTIRKAAEDVVRRARELIGRVKGLEEVSRASAGSVSEWLGEKGNSHGTDNDDGDTEVELVQRGKSDDENDSIQNADEDQDMEDDRG